MNPQLNKLVYANWMFCPNIPLPPFLSYLCVISNVFVVFKGTPFQKGELHIEWPCSVKCLETGVILESLGLDTVNVHRFFS